MQALKSCGSCTTPPKREIAQSKFLCVRASTGVAIVASTHARTQPGLERRSDLRIAKRIEYLLLRRAFAVSILSLLCTFIRLACA